MRMSRVAPLLGLALAMSGALPSAPRAVAAQPQPNTCTLLTHDDVQTLVPEQSHVIVSDGVAGANPAINFYTCRYTWGEGTGRYTLALNINPVARMFPGQNTDAIKLGILGSVRAETQDATISDVGDAAAFKAYSTAYASATAYVKDRILQVSLDGFDAVDKRDALVSLLKKAAAKL